MSEINENEVTKTVTEGDASPTDRLPPIGITTEKVELVPTLVPLDAATVSRLRNNKTAFIRARVVRGYSNDSGTIELDIHSDDMAILLSSGGQLVSEVTVISPKGVGINALEIIKKSTADMIATYVPNLPPDLEPLKGIPPMVVSARLLKESAEDVALFQDASTNGIRVPQSLIQIASNRMNIDLGSHVNVAHPPTSLTDLYAYSHELGHHVERIIRLSNAKKPEDMDLAVKDDEALAWHYADEIFTNLTDALGVNLESYQVMLLRFTAMASRFTHQPSELLSLMQDYNRQGKWGGLKGNELKQLVRIVGQTDRLSEGIQARISEKTFNIDGVREEDFLAAYDTIERHFTTLVQEDEVAIDDVFEFADRRTAIDAGNPRDLQDLQGYLIMHYYGEYAPPTRTANSLDGFVANGYTGAEPVGSFLVRSGVYSKLKPADAVLASGRRLPFFVEVLVDKGAKWISIRDPHEFVELHFSPFATLNNVTNPELTLPMLAMCIADFRSLLEILNNTRESDRPDHIVTYAATDNTRIVNLATKIGFRTARVHGGGSDSDQTILYASTADLLKDIESKMGYLEKAQATITRRGWGVERARKLAIACLAKNIVNATEKSK